MALLLFGMALPAAAENARGVVYADLNRNGARDPGENGVPGVLITNLRDFVSTDPEGQWAIDINEGDLIVLIKPAGYDLPVNDLNLPKFYYIHKPKGSPDFQPGNQSNSFFRASTIVFSAKLTGMIITPGFPRPDRFRPRSTLPLTHRPSPPPDSMSW
ncbi:MAG: hypothetical protein UZ16_OP3001002613 [Candidatus Hinthialibacteria bacterium OLB16]|nr:MAG: hypothetical protein UZ16_OP3001002613 [Candidatus Hinthialibacteria bacterium OLB16]